MTYIISFFILVLLTQFYIGIAKRYNIVDIPNERSSHKVITTRGLGIVFVLATMVFFVVSGFKYPFFMVGVSIVALVSFLDDIYTLSGGQRILVQVASMILVFMELGVFNEALILVLVFFVLGVGFMNAYNFMDGINGLTGGYSLISILSFYYINEFVFSFVDSRLLTFLGMGVIIFLFYNFRKKAKGFSGDVGSISMGLIVAFLMFKLILDSNDWKYLLLVFIYLMDTSCTIFVRLMDKQNIFVAHRRHFYQLLTNEVGIGHLKVSLLYAGMQAVLNCWIISYKHFDFIFLIPFLILLVISFLTRKRIEWALNSLPKNKFH